MAPKLYLSELSPPARSVLLTAAAIGLKLEHINIDLGKKEQLDPAFVKINPQHTVPTLVDDDGFVVWDSHAIMEYLIEKYAKEDSLYPKDVKQRAIINQRLHFDSVTSVVRGNAIRPLFHSGAKEIPEHFKLQFEEHYSFLESFLENSTWLAGNHVTIADLSLIPSITIADVVVPVDEKKYPKVVAWMKRAESWPYYEVNRNGHDSLKKFILEKLSE